MKAAFILLAIALPAAYCFYLQPNVHYMPARVNSRSVPVYKQLGTLFHRLHLASKRCANTFDDSCINDNLHGAASDEDFLNNSDLGKRCVNTFDEGCINGDLNGAGTDDDWLNGGDTPGRR